MTSENKELGVKQFCFGDFKCLTCKRSWESGLAWKDFGQECRSCHVNIKPHHIEEAYRYVCKECQIVWRWKWDDEGRACPKCGEIKKTLKNHRLVTKYIYANLKQRGEERKFHDQKLCEKCVILGRDCRDSVNMTVSDVLEIGATRRRYQSQYTTLPNSQNLANNARSSIASSKWKPVSVPVVINTADTFKKVTPALSYSAMVTGQNLNNCPTTSNHTVNTRPPIPNESVKLKKVASASDVSEDKSEDEDEDVYGNSAWAAAYKLEQEETRKNVLPSSTSDQTIQNGKTSNGNGYYYISVPVPTNGRSYQQQNSWGCKIL